MKPRVPIVRPELGDEEIAAVTRVIRSGWVTQGPEVAALEQEFAAAVGAPHAVAVANGTVALELALRGVGVRPGDDVVTVSHSFIATANAVVAVGARPVFVDIEEDTLGMDPRALERAMTPAVRAVLVVHQLGMPCDLASLLAVADGAGVPVVEDAACALGSELRWDGAWERAGRPRGRVATFSFHPRKVVTTGDGGMLTTRDEELARRLRLWRSHAMSVPDTVRHHSTTISFEEYVEPAWNHRLTDLQAATGRPQVARLARIIAERRAIAARYASALAAHPVLAAPPERPGHRSNWQTYATRLREGLRRGDQVAVMQELLDRGIGVKRGCANAHQEPAYAGGARHLVGPGGLPVSERMRDTVIALPLYHGMREDEIALVLQALADLAG